MGFRCNFPNVFSLCVHFFPLLHCVLEGRCLLYLFLVFFAGAEKSPSLSGGTCLMEATRTGAAMSSSSLTEAVPWDTSPGTAEPCWGERRAGPTQTRPSSIESYGHTCVIKHTALVARVPWLIFPIWWHAGALSALHWQNCEVSVFTAIILKRELNIKVIGRGALAKDDQMFLSMAEAAKISYVLCVKIF